MTTKLKAAERPWEIFIHRDGSGIEVGPPYGNEAGGALRGNVKGVADRSTGGRCDDPKSLQSFADMMFIARAANCYDALVAACKTGTKEAMDAALTLTKVPVKVNYDPYPKDE